MNEFFQKLKGDFLKPTQFKIVLDEISLIVINKKKKLKRTVDRDRKYVPIYLECTKTDVGKKKTYTMAFLLTSWSVPLSKILS